AKILKSKSFAFLII
ncbi:hypothetical protein CP02DC14_1692B, partial [Chlamydia psittaci 02DC14]